MKVGDLVKMKYKMWWMLRERKDFTQEPRIVVETDSYIVQLLCPSGIIRRELAEHYEVINASR